MKKIMVGLVLLGALLWGLEATGVGFLSHTYGASGTGNVSVTITGKPAGSISVYAVDADLAISWNNHNSAGATVPGGSTMTWTGVEIYNFTVTRTNATAFHVYTW